MATKTAGPKSVVVATTGRKIEEADIHIVGTAPMLVAHPLAWDIGGGYWEAQDPEIAKNKIKRPTPPQLELLEAIMGNGHGFGPIQPYRADRGLDTYQEAILRGHWLPDHTPAFPVDGFKGAVATGAVQYGGKNYGLSAKKLRAIEMFGDDTDRTLARIQCRNVSFDETMGINSGMTRSPRHIIRIRYDLPWTTTLRVRYNPTLLDVKQIVQVFEWAGDFGVGQRRPSSPHGGQYGTFQVQRGQ
jgi:hypothetical protein